MTSLKFDLSTMRKDQEMVNTGVVVDLGGDASVTIRAFDYAPFTEDFRKATKPYEDLGRTIPDDDQREILVRLVVKHLLLGWRNIYLDDVEVPFSPERATEILRDSRNDFFLTMLLTQMRKLENFRSAAREGTEGN